LALDEEKCTDGGDDSGYSSNRESDTKSVGQPIEVVSRRTPINRDVCGGKFADQYGGFFVFGGFAIAIVLEFFAAAILLNNHKRRLGWLLAGISLLFWLLAGLTVPLGRLPWDWWRTYSCQQSSEYRKPFQHITKNVSQKLLTPDSFRITLNTARQDMANVLGTDKKIAVVAALAEGSSIRSIERMTGIHRDTIMRLGVRVGQGCTILMHEKMRDLPCTRLEMDEIWGFVGKKDRNVKPGEEGVGNVWTFCAIDADTKLVPAFKVGDRDAKTATPSCRAWPCG
jgi:hypothetical protein